MTDTWNGMRLADANPTDPVIHYRIHDADTGQLLGFGSPGGSGALQAAARHYAEVQQENPGRRIVIRTYDRPAHFTGE